MSNKRRSLADDLNDLFNPAPAPELDPETAGVDLPVLNQVDDELTKHANQRPTRAAKEKPLLLRGDIQLDSGAYEGRKTTRAAIFGQDEFGSEGEEAGSDVDEDEDEEDNGPAQLAGAKLRSRSRVAAPKGRANAASEGSSDEGDEDEGSDEDAGHAEDQVDEDDLEERRASGSAASTRAAAGDAGARGKGARRVRQPQRPAAADHGGSSGEEGASGDEDEGEEDGGRLSRDPEAQQLDDEYRALQEAEQAAFAGLRERAERERAKGRAVAAQQSVYERALEARILLQKCVAGGNAMPRAGELDGVLAVNEGLREGYEALRSSALQTLSSLLQLHSALVDNNPAIRQAGASAVSAEGATANGGSKLGGKLAGKRNSSEAELENLTDLESAWRALEDQWGLVGPFRDASLDRWHRRTMLATGGAALKAGGLKALHQSVSAQVANLVRDNTKAVKRTRLTLSARPRVLCVPASTPATSGAPPSSSATATEAQDDPDEAQDPETFDDAEFYQQLLKELIDGTSAQGGVGGQKGPKKRKNVDRRASKGRKIRYQVHEKLVNFVAAVDAEVPVFAAQLFANLFGRSK